MYTLQSQNSLSSLSTKSSFSQNSISSVVSNSSNSKSIGFLDVIFGSVKASAGEYDNSWFWKNGESWTIGSYGWHEKDKDYFSDGIKSPSLDFIPPSSYKKSDGTWNNISVFAPKTATIVRAQDCPQNSTIAFGDMRILHLAPNSFASKNGISYKKNDIIGSVALGYNSNGTFTDFPCGQSIGSPHIHIKFLNKNFNIDGSNLNWDTDNLGNVTNGIGFGVGSSFTSQNSSDLPISDPNISTVLPT